MRVFISYARENAFIAEQILYALRGAGHKAFLDSVQLAPGEEYHSKIKSSIAESDAFVFLISPDSVATGGYCLTELEIAKQIWPAPSGHVLPVLVSPTPLETVDPYLTSVTLLKPAGNIAAEVASAIEDLHSRSVRGNWSDQHRGGLPELRNLSKPPWPL